MLSCSSSQIPSGKYLCPSFRLPTPNPETSHLTPVLQKLFLGLGMRKKLLSQRESAEWVVCRRKGRGSAVKHKGPPGVWPWHSPRPCSAHRLALKVGPARDTPLLRKALQPRSPKRPNPEVRGHLHIRLATTFRPALQPGMSEAAPPVLRASGRTHPSTPP